jgi:protein-tyrosine kinase
LAIARSAIKDRKKATLKPSIQSKIDALSADFKSLKGNLIGAGSGQAPCTLMITSSKNGEGKTLSAIGIAQTLNNSGQCKVLLVDANARAPILANHYALEQTAGLTELVLDQGEHAELCQKTSIAKLDLLSFGQLAQNKTRLFESNEFQKALILLSQHYSYVVVDADSILNTSEASLICPFFDGILMVVECESTKWQAARVAVDKINNAGGTLLGTLMNRRKFYIPRFIYGA